MRWILRRATSLLAILEKRCPKVRASRAADLVVGLGYLPHHLRRSVHDSGKGSPKPRLLAIALPILALPLTPLRAEVTVPSGCASPNSVSGHHAFYVDPAKGDKSNDGSAARPWRTLTEVLDPSNHLVSTQSYSPGYARGDTAPHSINVNGVIKPGDTIYLMTGDHGNPKLVGYANNDFITVSAAPGQAPVISSLKIVSSSQWLFRGINFQGPRNSNDPVNGLIEIGRSDWTGPSSDIILIKNNVSTQESTTNWSDIDWVQKPFYYGIMSYGSCVSIEDNTFFNLRNAIAVSSRNSLVLNNTLRDFGNDGIDITASDITIRHNTIESGHHSKAEELHADGIQGWATSGNTNRHIVIDSNTIKKIGDPDLSYMQGISIFDGKWDDISITNNVVVANVWHGIALYGINNATVCNNTVVASDRVAHPTWIMVTMGKDGSPSRNVIIRNNIAPALVYSGTDVTADHNILSRSITTADGGRKRIENKTGIFGLQNRIFPAIYQTLVNVDYAKGTYDLHLKAGSPAIGTGNPEQSPPVDIDGKLRGPAVDIGAYAFGSK